MGKAYANRKKEIDRPLNDFYPTPKCMVQELLNFKEFNLFLESNILDPCCGQYAIGNVLRNNNFTSITEKDIIFGNDFLKDNYDHESYECIIMNPPFKLFDEFVTKSKKVAYKVACIGKLNFFGAHGRNINGLWDNLEWVLPFDRMIAFDKPEDNNGKVECGMMVSAWFIWNSNYKGLPKIQVLDMQKYIKFK